jgi:hypothetical protein
LRTKAFSIGNVLVRSVRVAVALSRHFSVVQTAMTCDLNSVLLLSPAWSSSSKEALQGRGQRPSIEVPALSLLKLDLFILFKLKTSKLEFPEVVPSFTGKTFIFIRGKVDHLII